MNNPNQLVLRTLHPAEKARDTLAALDTHPGAYASEFTEQRSTKPLSHEAIAASKLHLSVIRQKLEELEVGANPDSDHELAA